MQDITDLLTDDAKKWRDEKAKKEADKQAEIEAKMQVTTHHLSWSQGELKLHTHKQT